MDMGESEPLTDDEMTFVSPSSMLKRPFTIDLTEQSRGTMKRSRSAPHAQLFARAGEKVAELVARAEACRSTGTLADAWGHLEQAGRIQRIVELMMDAPCL